MVLNCLSLSSILPLQADTYTYTGGAGNKVSDLDTSNKYNESLGDGASNEYAGRIWTDKSVYTDDATFDIFGGGTSTIKLNEKNNGEDFLVAYSALASSESVSSSEQAPVDVVLIIDISGSMSNGSSNMDNGKSRIYNTIVATNNAIDAILALDEYSRVAVVAFSGNTQVSNNSNIPDAQILLPLDRYTKTKDNQNKEVDYFTLSRESGNSNYAQLYTKAINSKNTKIDKTTHVSGELIFKWDFIRE